MAKKNKESGAPGVGEHGGSGEGFSEAVAANAQASEVLHSELSALGVGISTLVAELVVGRAEADAKSARQAEVDDADGAWKDLEAKINGLDDANPAKAELQAAFANMKSAYLDRGEKSAWGSLVDRVQRAAGEKVGDKSRERKEQIRTGLAGLNRDMTDKVRALGSEADPKRLTAAETAEKSQIEQEMARIEAALTVTGRYGFGIDDAAALGYMQRIQELRARVNNWTGELRSKAEADAKSARQAEVDDADGKFKTLKDKIETSALDNVTRDRLKQRLEDIENGYIDGTGNGDLSALERDLMMEGEGATEEKGREEFKNETRGRVNDIREKIKDRYGEGDDLAGLSNSDKRIIEEILSTLDSLDPGSRNVNRALFNTPRFSDALNVQKFVRQQLAAIEIKLEAIEVDGSGRAEKFDEIMADAEYHRLLDGVTDLAKRADFERRRGELRGKFESGSGATLKKAGLESEYKKLIHDMREEAGDENRPYNIDERGVEKKVAELSTSLKGIKDKANNIIGRKKITSEDRVKLESIIREIDGRLDGATGELKQEDFDTYGKVMEVEELITRLKSEVGNIKEVEGKAALWVRFTRIRTEIQRQRGEGADIDEDIEAEADSIAEALNKLRDDDFSIDARASLFARIEQLDKNVKDNEKNIPPNVEDLRDRAEAARSRLEEIGGISEEGVRIIRSIFEDLDKLSDDSGKHGAERINLDERIGKLEELAGLMEEEGGYKSALSDVDKLLKAQDMFKDDNEKREIISRFVKLKGNIDNPMRSNRERAEDKKRLVEYYNEQEGLIDEMLNAIEAKRDDDDSKRGLGEDRGGGRAQETTRRMAEQARYGDIIPRGGATESQLASILRLQRASEGDIADIKSLLGSGRGKEGKYTVVQVRRAIDIYRSSKGEGEAVHEERAARIGEGVIFVYSNADRTGGSGRWFTHERDADQAVNSGEIKRRYTDNGDFFYYEAEDSGGGRKTKGEVGSKEYEDLKARNIELGQKVNDLLAIIEKLKEQIERLEATQKTKSPVAEKETTAETDRDKKFSEAFERLDGKKFWANIGRLDRYGKDRDKLEKARIAGKSYDDAIKDLSPRAQDKLKP
jgi:hypothetical protein